MMQPFLILILVIIRYLLLERMPKSKFGIEKSLNLIQFNQLLKFSYNSNFLVYNKILF